MGEARVLFKNCLLLPKRIVGRVWKFTYYIEIPVKEELFLQFGKTS